MRITDHWTIGRVLYVMLTSSSLFIADRAIADNPPDFKPYVQRIPETEINFKMTPIPGGKFLMGSAEDEPDRGEDEGKQLEVTVDSFWMGTHEVTWNEFDVFCFSYDIKAAKDAVAKGTPLRRTPLDALADAVTRPTPPYVDMTFGYGHDNYPALCMTHHAAEQYCVWLSKKTGLTYRLPTEAEWEYAARAGSKSRYHFGSDPAALGDYAWYFENSNEKPHPVGEKKPNPWGLYDMHGNLSEWCADKYVPDYSARVAKAPVNPLIKTDETVWYSVRGGSYEDDPAFIRVGKRRGAEDDWSIQDPQIPKSIWWHTDARFVGFRVVRPYSKETVK